MKKLMVMLAATALIAGCGRTAMYSEPKGDDVAVIAVENHLDDDAGEQAQDSGGWQAPGSSQPARVGVFKVDGERTNEMGGNEASRLKGGEHTIQVFADDSIALRFGDVTWDFEAGQEYVIHIYKNDDADTDYRAELVNSAAPDKILKKVAF